MSEEEFKVSLPFRMRERLENNGELPMVDLVALVYMGQGFLVHTYTSLYRRPSSPFDIKKHIRKHRINQ